MKAETDDGKTPPQEEVGYIPLTEEERFKLNKRGVEK
jgi:hypothetical protein